jgi:hypothetical protein
MPKRNPAGAGHDEADGEISGINDAIKPLGKLRTYCFRCDALNVADADAKLPRNLDHSDAFTAKPNNIGALPLRPRR